MFVYTVSEMTRVVASFSVHLSPSNESLIVPRIGKNRQLCNFVCLGSLNAASMTHLLPWKLDCAMVSAIWG